MKFNVLNKKAVQLWEWREYEKGSLIENGIALNETATFIWKLCDGKRTINEIISIMVDKYDVERKVAEKDIVDCIKILVKNGAIRLK